MKLTHFKTLGFMLLATSLLTLTGCDKDSAPNEDGLVGTQPVVPPVEENMPPIANAGADQTVAYCQDVTLEGNASSDPDGTIVLYEWKDSSDAIIGNQANSVVSGLSEGIHTFSLTVTDDDGATDTDTVSVAVSVQACLDQANNGNGYGTIVIGSRTWLDRNLGANEVAATPTDTLAYGNLYQWGRSADGHQERTSDINDTEATTLDGSDTSTDWYGKFILSQRTNLDWVASSVDNNGSLREQSWSNPYDDINNPNQVCPCGYVVPTAQDFVDMNLSDPDTAAIFKVAYADRRAAEDGNITTRDLAVFWATTHANDNSDYYAMWLGSPGQVWDNGKRGAGVPVRCIRPLP